MPTPMPPFVPPGLTVRVAAPGDAERVAELYARSWRAAFGELLTEETVPTAALLEKGRAMVDAALCLVAVYAAGAGPRSAEDAAAELPLGVVAGDPATGLLDMLYVDPCGWRSGVGAALLTDATAALAATGSRPWLWVWTGNTRALTFYARHRWEPTVEHRVAMAGGHRFTYRRLTAPVDA